MSQYDRWSPREPPEEREKERDDIVRVFLFQSRGEDSILDTEDLANAHLTDLILIRKSGTVSADQLMPIGGKARKREDILRAGFRTAVEMTHLRPTRQSIYKFQTQQEVDFTHPDRGLMKNHVHFFSGRILPAPMDSSYALDPEEHKISDFEHLSPQQAQELFLTGKTVCADGTTRKIVDSLSPDPRDRKHRDVKVDERQVSNIAQEAIRSFRFTEASKKIDVLRHLFNSRKAHAMASKSRIPDIETSAMYLDILHTSALAAEQNDSEAVDKLIQEIEEFWRKNIIYFTAADVRQALHYSNLEAKLNNVTETYYDPRKQGMASTFDMETGKGIPSIDLILPLLLGDKKDLSALRILKENPQARKILKMLGLLQRSKSVGSTEDLLRKLEEEGSIDREFSDDFLEMGSAIDDFFIELQRTTNVPYIDQLDEVKGADLPTLLAYATGRVNPFEAGNGPRTSKRRQEIKEQLRTVDVLRWEAQRKLMLMLLLNDALKIYKTYTSLGVQPIIDLEAKMRDPRVRKPQPPALLLNAAIPLKQDRINRGNPHQYREVNIHSRKPKDILSILRKMIVRDEAIGGEGVPAMDIYGRSYVFNNVNPEDLAPKDFLIPINDNTGEPFVIIDKASGQPMKRLHAPQVIADLITTILTEGDGKVSILEYKPLPAPGKPIKNVAPGSGGDVRYAKFYICHQEGDIKRYEEIQVFVPDTARKTTGDEEYIRKYVDDERYRVQRLFYTHGLRSAIELLFPTQIYGNVTRGMYKGKVG